MQQIVKHRELTLIKNRSWRGTTPMTKNGTNSANSKQIVSVQSQDGENIGLTYPKRAAGLVKKGRARFVNDNTIRLMDVSDVTHTEDIKMDNINTLNENKNEPVSYTHLTLPTTERV